MVMSSEDPFLKEAWQRKVEEESGESPEKKSFELWERIQANSEKKEHLQDACADLKKSIIRYHKSISRLEETRGQAFEKEDIERADQDRRIAHDALIDKLNFLSREFVNANLDNRWRKEIGLDRDTAGMWAYNVGELLKKQSGV